jgi:hypothetical protein
MPLPQARPYAPHRNLWIGLHHPLSLSAKSSRYFLHFCLFGKKLSLQIRLRLPAATRRD